MLRCEQPQVYIYIYMLSDCHEAMNIDSTVNCTWYDLPVQHIFINSEYVGDS